MSYNQSQRFIQSVVTKFHGLRNGWKEVEDEEEAEPFLNEQMPHNFSHYRETLLGDN